MKKEIDTLHHLFFKTINHLKHITNMNILDEANKIVNDRSEEKERAYGSFSEGMKRAASIASGMTGKEITANDMFACMVALKFSRQSFNHKTDNMLDAVAYMGAWNNFIEEELANTKQCEPEPKHYTSTKERVEADLKDILSETGPNFKNDLESEIFPQVKKRVEEEMLVNAPGINDVISYQNYLGETIGNLVKYVEHIAEHSNKQYEKIEKFETIAPAVNVLMEKVIQLTSEVNKICTKIYMDSTD